MRRLAVRFTLWLCRVLEINPIEQERLSHGTDAVARGQRWEGFWREEGGLRDMLEALRREAFEAAAEVPPEEVHKLQYFAMSDRNIRRLQKRIEAVIVTGKVEADRRETVERSNVARIRR